MQKSIYTRIKQKSTGVQLMKLNVYTIYDDTAKAYMQPFFMHNHGLAVRAFTDQVNRNDENNPLNKHPEQFTLYYVGEFDDQTGNLELRDHQSLGKGVSYKETAIEEAQAIANAFEQFKTWYEDKEDKS